MSQPQTVTVDQQEILTRANDVEAPLPRARFRPPMCPIHHVR
ncbi:hypothetical protein I547_2719 [Mycobacterium kansasii 824]|nr:hypothetical protein I547_2719 [Mycobacterium kansasii 824]